MNQRKRSLSALLNKSSEKEPRKVSRKAKITCNCDECDGLFVDPRTELSHRFQKKKNKDPIDKEPKFRQRTRNAPLCRIMSLDAIQHSSIDHSSSENDENDDFSEAHDDDDISEAFGNFHNINENYSAPDFEPSSYSNICPDSRFTWILLWIMNFRIRFNLPDTATDALLKFMKLMLIKIGGDEFETFCGSLYAAKKFLGLSDQFVSFVACQKCHKLYKHEDVSNFQQNNQLSVMKCVHIEFPNSATRRKFCNSPLSTQSKLLNGSVTNRPELIFPYATIRQQLLWMYQHSDFESNLRHWVDRPDFDELLCDIYNGNIWKTFKDENSEPFFSKETADSHLGLVLNIDWFQPYINKAHSTGVIYAAIANLPRELRFKRENMLILGILPGPNEPSLHKINHYLSPIVDELLQLWQGIMLDSTAENKNGRIIRAALVLISCDIPAARKVCGHISALVSCYRCKKKANYTNNQHNFGGMDRMDEWFVPRDSAVHRQKAIEWRSCDSNAARKRFVNENLVRWSELLRLPYFDPIRHLVVDPMHCLFLGIGKWLVKRIWIEQGVLTNSALDEIQLMMEKFQVPSHIGRIPRKVNCGEGFSNFTADQWRNFFTIYATVVLWKYLPALDRQILTNFVKICQILVCRIVRKDMLKEAHERLITMIKLIEQKYGQEKITPNLHLSLHLYECAHDYGPLYTFWCFSFERMNGILGSLPNSHRKIEPELMRRLMNDRQIIHMTISTNAISDCFELLNDRSSIGSVSELDQFTTEELYRFLINTCNIQESIINGSEQFPGELLRPEKLRLILPAEVLELLVEYYEDSYETLIFRKPFTKNIKDSVIVRNIVEQYGRCRIGSEIFDSALYSRNIKGSFVLARFVNHDGSIDLYPGQVQFFFTHSVSLPNNVAEHKLAFIRWFKPANSAEIRFNFGSENDANVELWSTEFYPIKRECIIPIHNIFSQFVPFRYRISGRKSSRVYLAVIPINRKYNI